MARPTQTKLVVIDKRLSERAVHALSAFDEADARVEQASEMFLGRPYASNPLRGGPTQREVLRISFDEFDCVTYVETVIALACSRSSASFMREIRGLRYANAKVDWFSRNHFMTSWLKRNVERGSMTNLTRGCDTVSKTRTLEGVAGLEPHRTTVRFFPKRHFARVRSRIRTGDLIMFVSTKKHLDVFHMGLLILRGDKILLRHATRSAGKVIEQDLNDFLRSNRMSGFIFARPSCQR